jgi:hypothetical protein
VLGAVSSRDIDIVGRENGLQADADNPREPCAHERPFYSVSFHEVRKRESAGEDGPLAGGIVICPCGYNPFTTSFSATGEGSTWERNWNSVAMTWELRKRGLWETRPILKRAISSALTLTAKTKTRRGWGPGFHSLARSDGVCQRVLSEGLGQRDWAFCGRGWPLPKG